MPEWSLFTGRSVNDILIKQNSTPLRISHNKTNNAHLEKRRVNFHADIKSPFLAGFKLSFINEQQYWWNYPVNYSPRQIVVISVFYFPLLPVFCWMHAFKRTTVKKSEVWPLGPTHCLSFEISDEGHDFLSFSLPPSHHFLSSF